MRHHAVDSHNQRMSHSTRKVNLGIRKGAFERYGCVIFTVYRDIQHGTRETLDGVGGGEG